MNSIGHYTKSICGYTFSEVYPQKEKQFEIPFSSVVIVLLYETRDFHFLCNLHGFKLIPDCLCFAYFALAGMRILMGCVGEGEAGGGVGGGEENVKNIFTCIYLLNPFFLSLSLSVLLKFKYIY